MVKPILLYGCEIWGFGNNDVLEKVHLKFCKMINFSFINVYQIKELCFNAVDSDFVTKHINKINKKKATGKG
jgi:hypothetical protein